jgi:hypothetical protein
MRSKGSAQEQEFVSAEYTELEGARKHFAGLLVGF